MKTPLAALLLLGSLALAPIAAHAQNEALLQTLTRLSNDRLAAWQKHDKAAFLAGRDPHYMYVGPQGIIETTHPIDNLMKCTIKSYDLRKPTLQIISPDAAILIAEQHQDILCFGQQQPAVVNITNTFIRRGGFWHLLLSTESPAIVIAAEK